MCSQGVTPHLYPLRRPWHAIGVIERLGTVCAPPFELYVTRFLLKEQKPMRMVWGKTKTK